MMWEPGWLNALHVQLQSSKNDEVNETEIKEIFLQLKDVDASVQPPHFAEVSQHKFYDVWFLKIDKIELT